MENKVPTEVFIEELGPKMELESPPAIFEVELGTDVLLANIFEIVIEAFECLTSSPLVVLGLGAVVVPAFDGFK